MKFKFKKFTLLNEKEINLINKYCLIKHINNRNNFGNNKDLEITGTLNTSFYGDPLIEALMSEKKTIIEKEVNLKLLETYSYWRMYTMFSKLAKHKDREACEISVTVMLGSDGTDWPIFIEGESISLLPGEAVIYHGIESEHWRDEFKGDWHAQVFMHYVDANGLHKEEYLDRRNFLGQYST
jgi:hypothetical protein